jgi:hypothetical protein
MSHLASKILAILGRQAQIFFVQYIKIENKGEELNRIQKPLNTQFLDVSIISRKFPDNSSTKITQNICH